MKQIVRLALVFGILVMSLAALGGSAVAAPSAGAQLAGEDCAYPEGNSSLGKPRLLISSPITVSGSTATAKIENRSAGCTFQVGLASYQVFELSNGVPRVSTQEIVDYKTAMLSPGQSVSFTIAIPNCLAQIETFYGNVILDLSVERYGERVLNVIQNGTTLCTQGGGGYTYTQGYWKNHPDAWPVQSIKLGTVTYTKAQAIAILKQPVKGNGLVSLSHQLIAAKLNTLNGADDSAIASAIASADAMIGGLVVPPVGNGKLPTSNTSSLIGKLDAYNNGVTGPGHCG